MANYFDEMERSSFDRYDGPASGAQTKRAPSIATLDITIVNNAAVTLYAELFAGGVSMFNTKRTEWVTGNYTYKPIDSTEVFAATAADAGAVNDGTCGFNAAGDGVVRGLDDATAMTISCGQISYRQLLKATESRAFDIDRIRYTVKTDDQIDKQITHFSKSLLGVEVSSKVNPRSWFNPDQNQAKIIDIPATFQVSAEKGLYLPVIPGETVKFNMRVTEYTENTTR